MEVPEHQVKEVDLGKKLKTKSSISRRKLETFDRRVCMYTVLRECGFKESFPYLLTVHSIRSTRIGNANSLLFS
jgi:hypothetical protein